MLASDRRGYVKLFARRGALPPADDDPWTTFEMSLREPAPIPRAFDFTRFLASSITFMAHLLEVSVYLDDQRISRVAKDPGLPKSIGIPKGLKKSSPQNTMQVNDVLTTRVYFVLSSCMSPADAVGSAAHQGGSHSVGIHGGV